jgi:competence CoiA-like predicted nuclease
MPFVALDSEAKKRVCIMDHPKPRETLSGKTLVCPLCAEKLTIVSGLIRVLHFRHAAECSTTLDHHPQSEEHILGKQKAAVFLAREYPGWTLDFEVPMPDINRVADVTASSGLGETVVAEIQLSSITTEDLEMRTKAYRSKGVDVYWFLGKSAQTPANTRWVGNNIGTFFCIEFSQETDVRVFEG